MTTSSPPYPRTAGSRLPASVLHLATRLIRSAYCSLSACGWIWIGAVPAATGTDPVHGPAPGHPERLTGSPLTPLERALERELTG
ncbi:DUF6059 family protein [Streptomyces cynarae]|uniref:DUF6059 family protein n=1 Tax=Streptomyces cynarae TaxID=2981134 RepID=UPI00406D2396